VTTSRYCCHCNIDNVTYNEPALHVYPCR